VRCIVEFVRVELLRRPGPWIFLTSVILGLWLVPRFYVADLQNALVREANEIVAAPRARQVHVDAPRPGSFADALRAPLPRYENAWKSLLDTDDARALASAVAKGERPLSDLPSNVASALPHLDADLDALLDASHVERADLGPDHDPFGPFKGTSWMGLQAAARHAALRIRTTAPNHAVHALTDCIDGLALGRDAAISGGLVGRMIRAAIVGLLTPSCAEAISASDIGDARVAGQRLRRIRDSTPSFGTTLREEGIQVQLLAYGPGLTTAMKERLLPRPRAFAEDGSMAVPGVLGPLRTRLAWRDLRKLQERLVAIGMLPAPERDAAFAALGTSSYLLRFLFGDLDGPEPVQSYASYSRRDAAAGLQLDLLVAAVAARDFDARRGRWPSSVAELVADGLLDPDEARRLARAILDEQRPGRELKLIVPVPKAAAGDLGEAIVRVSRTEYDAAVPRRD
jgi:hypothetical protein